MYSYCNKTYLYYKFEIVIEREFFKFIIHNNKIQNSNKSYILKILKRESKKQETVIEQQVKNEKDVLEDTTEGLKLRSK